MPRPTRAPLLSALSPEPPRFIKEPKDQIGVSGGVASFVCQATGDLKPRVTWNKKGKKVNSQRFEVSRGRGGGEGRQLRASPTPGRGHGSSAAEAVPETFPRWNTGSQGRPPLQTGPFSSPTHSLPRAPPTMCPMRALQARLSCHLCAVWPQATPCPL